MHAQLALLSRLRLQARDRHAQAGQSQRYSLCFFYGVDSVLHVRMIIAIVQSA